MSESILINESEIAFKNPQKETVVEEAARVYIKVDENGFITNINSDKFLKDLNGWIFFDEGVGDRFVHAQNLYFEKPLVDEKGKYIHTYSKQ